MEGGLSVLCQHGEARASGSGQGWFGGEGGGEGLREGWMEGREGTRGE